MKVVAHGLLRHRFWGEYSAAIGLVFDSETEAALALPLLGGAPWAHGARHREYLVWDGDSAALEAVKAVLARYGADPAAIDSIAHSVDYGDPFTVAFDVEDPNQVRLDL